MISRFTGLHPTEMPFETVLPILFLGGLGYFCALALTWLTA